MTLDQLIAQLQRIRDDGTPGSMPVKVSATTASSHYDRIVVVGNPYAKAVWIEVR